MRLEQLIKISRRPGGERGAESHDNGDYPHCAASVFSTVLISEATTASIIAYRRRDASTSHVPKQSDSSRPWA
jgi:hypothetical protein